MYNILEERRIILESFEEVYEKYYKRLWCFLYKLSGDRSLAEEITQETLYKAFLHMEQYKGKSNIFTWFCGIAKNNWILEFKRQKRFLDFELSFKLSTNSNVEQEIVDKQMLVQLRKEIYQLPEPYRTVCILKIYAELSYGDIALEFKKSESWARVTFFRGKTMLIERMNKTR